MSVSSFPKLRCSAQARPRTKHCALQMAQAPLLAAAALLTSSVRLDGKKVPRCISAFSFLLSFTLVLRTPVRRLLSASVMLDAYSALVRRSVFALCAHVTSGFFSTSFELFFRSCFSLEFSLAESHLLLLLRLFAVHYSLFGVPFCLLFRSRSCAFLCLGS